MKKYLFVLVLMSATGLCAMEVEATSELQAATDALDEKLDQFEELYADILETFKQEYSKKPKETVVKVKELYNAFYFQHRKLFKECLRADFKSREEYASCPDNQLDNRIEEHFDYFVKENVKDKVAQFKKSLSDSENEGDDEMSTSDDSSSDYVPDENEDLDEQ